LDYIQEVFNLQGKTALITGGGGVLGGAIGEGLALAGANVILAGLGMENVKLNAGKISASGGIAVGIEMDVLDADIVRQTCAQIKKEYKSIDILVNAAGGNRKGATIMPDQTIFNLDLEEFDKVTDLNYKGTVIPTLEVCKIMSEQKKGSVINITSMAATRSITRVVGYSAAKAAVSNFTSWMAMEMARKFGDGIRVNAIAPGFFISGQNKALLLEADGSLTERGRLVINHTPMNRFGKPQELIGAVLFLGSDASSFVTGVILPVDGGFSSFSGV
jgi:NAD(P)-dependent dehydrogenase (short-subunit alcohol dehydrogenase family)